MSRFLFGAGVQECHYWEHGGDRLGSRQCGSFGRDIIMKVEQPSYSRVSLHLGAVAMVAAASFRILLMVHLVSRDHFWSWNADTPQKLSIVSKYIVKWHATCGKRLRRTMMLGCLVHFISIRAVRIVIDCLCGGHMVVW